MPRLVPNKFLRLADRLRFEPHRIELDRTGRYDEPLEREFPFVIKLFHFRSRHYTPGLTWHDRLELFIPVDGRARLRMGEQELVLAPREICVVDNLKLHGVVDFRGFDARVIVISFRPEFVYTLGSPSHDYTFLLPFYSKLANLSHVVRTGAELLPPMHEALARLLHCYFDEGDPRHVEAGCKAYFLELLYLLARHFRSSELLKSEFIRQQERTLKLKPLFDFVSCHYAERISLPQAAALTRMSQPQFIKLFKRVAGMTFVAYLTHLRLTNAHRLLAETAQTIAEIANHVGFSDQSYFDRRFKAAFGQTPREVRSRHIAG
ncbi:MAG: AraC family transcriptional regulator [Chthoniobacteraceae bacterium]